MSDEHRDHYYLASFQEDHHHVIDETGAYNQKPPSIVLSSTYGSQVFDDPSSYMSFTDYNSLANAFGLSPSSSEVFSIGDLGGGGNNNENPVTPNSSVSFSSSEAGGEEDSGKTKKENPPKVSEDGGQCSKKE